LYAEQDKKEMNCKLDELKELVQLGNEELKKEIQTGQRKQDELVKLLEQLMKDMTVQEVHKSLRNAGNKVSRALSIDLSSVIIPENKVVKEKLKKKGGFGAVYMGKYNFATVAIKELLVTELDDDSHEEFLQEAIIMR
jgi:hypothetical protein